MAGIGASAGGLDAFKKFFTAMPPDSGIAFVLVPHLDPVHKSLMVELLARHTTMPVVEVENDMPVEANHVYIIPPNKYMTIHDGVLRLTGPVERHPAQTSIDLFLCSLADDQQERSICIILSGTGSHGTLGLKAVKEAGGMAMVQEPATAEYERMPQSAVATGLADYVLPAEQMPAALVKYVRHGYVNGGTHIDAAPEGADHLTQVLALLQARSKFDFRAYRKKMVARRVERRMGLSQLDSIPEYLAFLRGHPEELKQLVKDLFISVTSFFRDAEAFQQLASQVIAPLVESKEAGAVIRVWVPGCATGEEPYSIAMLFQEQLAAAHKSCRVQIFATDVDEDALAVARKGLYPESIAADVSPERLAHFFAEVDEHSYQINKQVRETVIFAAQNLISDAPFTKLDLLSCRNLLIYLEADVQKKLLTLFHFALKEGGFLFLGPSETIGQQTDLFEPLSKKWRFYRRIGPTRPERVDFPIGAVAKMHETGSRAAGAGGAGPINLAEVTQRLLLEQFAPAAVLINRKYEVFYFFGPCSQYLEFPIGEPTRDLIQMAREGLSTKLRGAIHRAIRENQNVAATGSRVKRNGGQHQVRVTVRPVQAPKAAEGLLLVTFEEEAPSAQPSSAAGQQEQGGAGDDSALRQLENELNATREDLQSTIEEMESANEELKASNEEVMSMNEELQSANEELETSKEKLQSLNEELTTVNSQLHEKVQELETAENELKRINAELNQRVADRTAALREEQERLQTILDTAMDAVITIDQRGIIQSVNGTTERMFGYAAAEMVGQNVKMLMPSPYQEEHDDYLARYLRTGEKHIIGIGREVEARNKDGSVFPIDLAVSEIEHLQLFTGIIRDITRPKELEREVVEIASLEQRRIGHDLHDSVGQELTALNLLAKDLTEILQNDATKASPLIEQMIQGLQRSQRQLRGALRGLLPVPVDTEGLMAALADLADHIQREGKVACSFDCPRPVSVADNPTATHLYLIAQEAVHNAIRHARAREVRVALQADRGLVLRVQDDGIGMPARLSEHQGWGLRIMRNRAAIIGAKLTIEPAQPKGTVVTCSLPRFKNDPKQTRETRQDPDR
jgi:PAS domain S-box-containing protein